MYFTSKQAEIKLKLLSLPQGTVETLNAFRYEDRYFLGNYERAVDNFVRLNPTGGDFYVWLQDHYKEVRLR